MAATVSDNSSGRLSGRDGEDGESKVTSVWGEETDMDMDMRLEKDMSAL